MGNYGTTYPQMGKNEYTRKNSVTTKRWPPEVLLTLSEDAVKRLKFSLASSISCVGGLLVHQPAHVAVVTTME